MEGKAKLPLLYVGLQPVFIVGSCRVFNISKSKVFVVFVVMKLQNRFSKTLATS